MGVSHDSIDTLNKFSVSECRPNKFAVASDADQSITKSYDAVLAAKPEYANRTSYVIAPHRQDHLSVHGLEPGQGAFDNTLAAVQKWKADHKGS